MFVRAVSKQPLLSFQLVELTKRSLICSRSSMDGASRFYRQGWGFESLREHKFMSEYYTQHVRVCISPDYVDVDSPRGGGKM